MIENTKKCFLKKLLLKQKIEKTEKIIKNMEKIN